MEYVVKARSCCLKFLKEYEVLSFPSETSVQVKPLKITNLTILPLMQTMCLDLYVDILIS